MGRVPLKGVHGDTGRTCRGLVETFNVKCDGTSSRDLSSPF